MKASPTALLAVALIGVGALGARGWWSARERAARSASAADGALSAGSTVDAAGAGRGTNGVRTGAGADAGASGSQADGAATPTAPGDTAWLRARDANEEGLAALDAGELERAVERFEVALELRPSEAVFAGNLAEALARHARGRRQEAADRQARARARVLLERAIALAPGRDELARLLARWRTEDEAEAGFERVSSRYFELAFDGERATLLHGQQLFLDRLEQAYGDLARWFGRDPVIEDGRPAWRVVLYDREGFDRVTGLGHWAAGAFDGTIRLPLDERWETDDRWAGVLRHELVHAFLKDIAGSRVPGWFNEGLAQWLERDVASRRAAARRMQGQTLVALDELLGSLTGWSDAERIRFVYAQSLALVDHIATAYGPDALRGAVAAVADGGSVASGLLQATGVPLEAVFEDFARARGARQP